MRRGHEVVQPARAGWPLGNGEKAGRFVSRRAVRFGDVADPRRSCSEAIRGENGSTLSSRASPRATARRGTHGPSITMRRSTRSKRRRPPAFRTSSFVGDLRAEAAARIPARQARLEKKLIESGLTGRSSAPPPSSRCRPDRARAQGKVFRYSATERTACKPISDDDLADYIAGCLSDDARRNRVPADRRPGPGHHAAPAGERLFELFGKPAKFRSVPVGMFDAIAGVLGALGRIAPPLAEKAEFARIARYYATESMLLLDPATGRYDADATPRRDRKPCSVFLRETRARRSDGRPRRTRDVRAATGICAWDYERE